MKFLLCLALVMIGCASPKQIATCVQACENINAIVGHYDRLDDDVICVCERVYKIDKTGTNTQEITR